jgi:hypothetical protein
MKKLRDKNRIIHSFTKRIIPEGKSINGMGHRKGTIKSTTE